jgi:RNA polymerase sigma factor (sigma-70 family)
MMSRSTELLRHLRRVTAPRAGEFPADADLLARFARSGEESAFAALVARHGPMVLAVCRRVLADAHAAEDACQAAFLVLARKAGSLRRPERLAAWLHGVARRVALRSRGRRPAAEPVALLPDLTDPRPDPLAAVSVRELLLLIDEEVARLPEAYRLPLLLCGMEGRSLEEAAQLLGWTRGSVKGRLERARRRLHTRLERRGLALPAALLAVELGAASAASALSAALPAAVARAAADFASGAGRRVADRSAPVALAEATLRGMAGVSLRTFAVLLLAVGLLAGGAGVALREMSAAPPAADDPQPAPAKAAAAPAEPVDRLGDPLPPGAIARMGTVRFRHSDSVNYLAFTPDGKLCVSADWSEVRVSEVATGKLVRRIGGDFGTHLRGMCLAADGKTVLTLSQEGGDGSCVRVWETATGKELRRLDCDRWSSMTLAPDGRTLATYTHQALRVWDAATGKELRQWAVPGQVIHAAAFTPDGRSLITGGDDKTIRFWEVATGKETRRFRDLPLGVSKLSVSPDGKTLAWVGAKKETHITDGGGSIMWHFDHSVHLRDLKTGGEVGELRCDGPPLDPAPGDPYGIVAVAFSPDGKSLLTAGNDASVRVWDLDTRKERQRWPVAWVGQIAFSPSGDLVALGTGSGVVFRGLGGKGQPPALPGHQARVHAAAFSPRGDTLASAGEDGTIRLWDPATGAERRHWRAHPVYADALAWSPDGRLLLSTGRATLPAARWDEVFRVWDPATGQERLGPAAAGDAVRLPVVSPDGRTVACSVGDKTVRLWELDTGREVKRLVAGEEVVCLAFSPDGGSLLARGKGKNIRIWDLKSGQERRTVATGFSDSPYGAAFSPDTRLLAAVGQGRVLLYDTSSGREVRRLTALPGTALKIAFSPDGRTLAAGDFWQSTISLVEVSTGQIRKQFTAPKGRIFTLTFAPDGKSLASGGTDSALLVWDMLAPPDGWRGPPKRLADWELMRYWDDLADANGATAYRALTALVLAPEQAIPYLARRLRPVAARSPEERRRTARLIADLDADEFDVREKATAELKRLGESAEPALRVAAAGHPSPELLQRAESLLRELEKSPEGKEWLRLSRAVEVLEWAGTPEARKALAEMAGGEPDARLTREAKESLGRLAIRTKLGRSGGVP